MDGDYLPAPGSGRCHLNRGKHSQVVGGKDAELFHFPFTVLLGYDDPRNPDEELFEGILYLCGGTLINRR